MNPVFSAIFAFGALLLLVAEIVGIRRPGKGDTITEHWRALDTRLQEQPAIRWAYRVFTIGVLVWAGLHFLAGVS